MLFYVWHNCRMPDMTLRCLFSLCDSYTVYDMILPWLFCVWDNCIMSDMTISWLLYALHNPTMIIQCLTLPYHSCPMPDMTQPWLHFFWQLLNIWNNNTMTFICLTWPHHDCSMSEKLYNAWYGPAKTITCISYLTGPCYGCSISKLTESCL